MKTLKILFLSILLTLSLVTGASAEFFTDVIVTSANGIWTDSRAYSTLNAAITAVGANQRTVVIASPQVVTNLTVPANVTLKFERDGAIVNSGQLTINTKNIIADNHQIFTGLGDLDFASGSVLRLSWFHNLWNALTMTSDDTVTIIMNKSINATASCAVGNNVTLRWEAPGNILTSNAGVTISNIGQIESGNYQILAGAGNFRFRDGTNLNSSWFVHLRNVIDWVSTNRVTLVVQGTFLVDLDDTVPSNLFLDLTSQRGLLSISGGVTLTINSAIWVGPYQWITGAGTVVLPSIAYHYPEWYSATEFTSTTLNDAITAVGATAVTFMLRPGTWAITADVTVPANVKSIVSKGAILTVATTKTLTFNGQPEIGKYQVFSCTGTGKVVFGQGSIKEILPDWWGGKGDDSTNNYVAIQAALTALSTLPGAKVVVGDGIWRYGTGLSWIGSQTQFECQGLLKYTGVGAATAFQVGDVGAAAGEYSRMKGTIRIADFNGSIWDVAKIGVQVQNIFESEFDLDIGGITATEGGFATGLKVYGNNTNGSSYNKFTLRRMLGNKIGIHTYADGGGWVNENLFIGGRFAGAPDSGNYTDSYHVKNNNGNSNVYLKNSFEQKEYTYYFYTNAQYNSLIAPRIEGTPTYRVYVDTGGGSFRFYPGYNAGITIQPHYGYVNLSAYGWEWVGDRYSIALGLGKKIRSGGTMPTTGTFERGDIFHHYDASVINDPVLKYCITGGTYSAATDGTGSTDGSGPIITGMTDTSGFYVGEYVTVSGGFPSITAPYQILAKTANSLTLNTNSNAISAGVTVATPDPVWKPIAWTRDDNTPNEVLLSTTTLALDADADTVLYTVPAGLRCVLTKAILVAGANANSTDLSIGQDTAETDWLPTNQLDNLDAAFDSVILMPVPSTTPAKVKSYGPGTVIEAKVSNQAGGATNTLYLYGMLY